VTGWDARDSARQDADRASIPWLDGDAGPVVRPYAMTRGRTRPKRGDFDLISIVLAARRGISSDEMFGPETAEIIRCCQAPVSVAEISAHLNLPSGTVKVLLGDLLEAGLIHTRAPARDSGVPDDLVLGAVVHALRSL
jgi:hypothetical protein